VLDVRVVDRAEHQEPHGRDVTFRAMRVAVLIPCHGEGELIAEAVGSIQEDEPVEIAVVDDASPDERTRATLDALDGVTVIRLEQNQGVGNARTTAFEATQAPYVYPLDADDLAIPGVLARMADRLDADPGADACVGDIVEFGDHEVVRRIPDRLDPYRVALTNEYPITALYRRGAVAAAGAWRPFHERQGYEDWNLWMGLAERGARIVHVGGPGYRRRLHGERLNQLARRRHRERYEAMRRAHPELFARLKEHRRASDLPLVKRALYPLVYGARAEIPFERQVKPLFDRLGIWTRAAR
jgi:glycosyltransferase involved in cell wall biosynthesis